MGDDECRMEDGGREERHAPIVDAANAFKAAEEDFAKRPHFHRETFPALPPEMSNVEDEPHQIDGGHKQHRRRPGSPTQRNYRKRPANAKQSIRKCARLRNRSPQRLSPM